MEQAQVSVNIRSYKLDAFASVDIDLQAVSDGFYNHFMDVYPPLLCNEAQYYGIGAQVYSPTVPYITYYSAEAPLDGTGGAGGLPKQTCGLISLYTDLGGRRNRGRLYVPFPPKVANGDNARPTDPYFVKLQDLRDTLLATVTAGGGSWIPAMTPTVVSPVRRITKGVVRNVWATQRRRGDYGKTNTLPF